MGVPELAEVWAVGASRSSRLTDLRTESGVIILYAPMTLSSKTCTTETCTTETCTMPLYRAVRV